jgi:hypothetical protein
MRTFFITMVLLFGCTFMVNAQQVVTQTETPADNPNAPEISFDNTVHDYGTMVQGADGACEFKFKNTGKEPLILSKPISSCGCTVPTWPQEPILPGKSDVIKVTYNTNNIGPINKTVTVYSNAKTNRVVLSIKGQVVAKPTSTVPEKPADNTATPVNPSK